MKEEILELALRAKKAQSKLLSLDAKEKNNVLRVLAEEILDNKKEILRENAKDIKVQKDAGIPNSLIDRLTLTESRINEIVEGIESVVELPCPLKNDSTSFTINKGIEVKKVKVPFGLIGIIYEARPNVTVDAAALCLKAGSAVLLRGSQSAINSNLALVKVMQDALSKCNLPRELISLIPFTERESVNHMLSLKGVLDVVIPRGGAGLIDFVVDNSKVPVIETGAGNCHVFIDASADFEMAKNIVINAKTQRPSVCNAIETVLIHKDFPKDNISKLFEALNDKNVELRLCEKSIEYFNTGISATEEDYKKEFLDYILAIKIVDDVNDAINHINKYGTKHSECIVSSDKENISLFQTLIDAAAVYANVSTRFTDGFQFGFGAEIGISTQKLHARGPMGLAQIVTYKYVISGNGEIRQ